MYEKGLAYRKQSKVTGSEVLHGAGNEQVVNGRCCVMKILWSSSASSSSGFCASRNMPTNFCVILDKLEGCRKKVRTMQRNWIAAAKARSSISSWTVLPVRRFKAFCLHHARRHHLRATSVQLAPQHPVVADLTEPMSTCRQIDPISSANSARPRKVATRRYREHGVNTGRYAINRSMAESACLDRQLHSHGLRTEPS